MANQVKFLHLRARVDGKPLDKGGYTIAFVRDGKQFRVALSMCHAQQRYNPTLGEKVAEERLSHGHAMIQDGGSFKATLSTIHNKLCVGDVPPIDTSFLEQVSE